MHTLRGDRQRVGVEPRVVGQRLDICEQAQRELEEQQHGIGHWRSDGGCGARRDGLVERVHHDICPDGRGGRWGFHAGPRRRRHPLRAAASTALMRPSLDRGATLAPCDGARLVLKFDV
jgi:hypothetical protein